ncbi:hypothetical protein SAMN05216267_1024143 [Actinacidiphila rubida]|uniref:DUF8175 domain-containing protein n=2 Tax=Actinacidiphila rubida TaxID=310780 RepID=A0A1H8P7U7_9ACTN|nr:hypothetical protein SAMN05216267_1024143 [Actinacidiphila rubida]
MPEGHGGGSGRRQAQPRRALFTVVGIVVLLVAAIAFANRGDGSGSSGSGGTRTGGSSGGKGSTSSSATAPTGERPVSGRSGGIPAGFARTEQGAQSAAANYAVALGGVDMFNADRRHAIVSAVYGPNAGAVQGSLDRAYSGNALKALGLRDDGTAPAGLTFVSRTVPVGTKVTASGTDAATVEVWCTDLVGLAGQGSTNPVSSAWFTVTEKLVWAAGDWKLQSSSQKDGPAPVNGDTRAATADEIAGAVQQYGGFTYAR